MVAVVKGSRARGSTEQTTRTLRVENARRTHARGTKHMSGEKISEGSLEAAGNGILPMVISAVDLDWRWTSPLSW
jgi:hypothetical protein